MPINQYKNQEVPKKENDVNIVSIEIPKIESDIKVPENITILDEPNADISKIEDNIKITDIEVPKKKIKTNVEITKIEGDNNNNEKIIQYNNKFYLIINNKINKVILKYKECFEYLPYLNFEVLKILDLSMHPYGDLSQNIDMGIIEKVKFTKLERLSFCWNYILKECKFEN